MLIERKGLSWVLIVGSFFYFCFGWACLFLQINAYQQAVTSCQDKTTPTNQVPLPSTQSPASFCKDKVHTFLAGTAFYLAGACIQVLVSALAVVSLSDKTFCDDGDYDNVPSE